LNELSQNWNGFAVRSLKLLDLLEERSAINGTKQGTAPRQDIRPSP
jgi:hypothetical protein